MKSNTATNYGSLGLAACLIAALTLLGAPAPAQDTVPTASLTISNALPDTEALLPLQNWSPLFRIELASSSDDYAERWLTRINYSIINDPKAGDRAYNVLGSIEPHHIYEFALIREGKGPDDDGFNILGNDDVVLYVWDNTGYPIGTANGLNYTINFPGPPEEDEEVPGPDDLDYPGPYIKTGSNDYPSVYYVAVRTSAMWYSSLSLSYLVTNAYWVDASGNFPLGAPNTEGVREPLDTVTPDFFEGDVLNADDKNSYSSSFSAYDISPGLFSEYSPTHTNEWNWPNKEFTPLPEYWRPRWDKSTDAVDLVTGEWMNVRRVFAVETWTAVVGLNLHSTDESVMELSTRTRLVEVNGAEKAAELVEDPQALGVVRNSFGGIGVGLGAVGGAYPVEANVVMTDIHADPLGLPGNGGVDPREGFDTLEYQTLVIGGKIILDRGMGRDSAFNSVWLWQDSGGTANVFDPPTPTTDTGATLNDRPMLPMGWRLDDEDSTGITTFSYRGYFTPSELWWEHIANPPTGGDPWWRIKLLFGYVRASDGGPMRVTPDGNEEYGTAHYPDYFIVLRPDSGYADCSKMPGDGTGLTIGAETRVFIEPRHSAPYATDPNTEEYFGGLIVSSQIPLEWGPEWRQHPAWNPYYIAMGGNNPQPFPTPWEEPWWTERTQDQYNTKRIIFGLDVNELIMTYENNNAYASSSEADISYLGDDSFGLPDYNGYFSRWMDPFGKRAAEFLNVHYTGVSVDRIAFSGVDDSENGVFQKPFETAPFFSAWDAGPAKPRSTWYPTPPTRPIMPMYRTWPYGAGAQADNQDEVELPVGQYPRWKDWRAPHRAARLLRQHVESSCRQTAMLGFNLVGANDPITNQYAPMTLKQITVAFYGEHFSPSDLMPLDTTGLDDTSGVGLFVDTGSGTFTDTEGLGGDYALELNGLAWSEKAELIDTDGDMVANDLNGDGLVNDDDKAWVLQISLSVPWRAPIEDLYVTAPTTAKSLASELGDTVDGDDFWTEKPKTYDRASLASQDKPATKVVGDESGDGNAGDDLFLVIRTSETIRRFSRFQVFVPGWLPERPENQAVAGIQFAPNNFASASAYNFTHPEEVANKQGFYENTHLIANVGAEVTNLVGTAKTVLTNGTPVAVLGIDASTNRSTADAVAASGANGVGGSSVFTVAGAGWAENAMAGYWLVDNRYESYEIVSNTADTLVLLSGDPRSGSWYIAKDPTFLEQVIVEFYDDTTDEEAGHFILVHHLLPLALDPRTSGVAIYRDNDNSAANTNGVFDADVDIPVELDILPHMIGQTGEPSNQVLFVFSTPGTDDFGYANGQSGAIAMADQTRKRQIIPDRFGTAASDAARGPDFFVVIRAADRAEAQGVTFRAGIVSWGPNTPTLPDPDTFPAPPNGRVNEIDAFDEFPWAARGLGFITFFNDIKDYDPDDNSGYNWVRSRVNKHTQTGIMTIKYETTPSPEKVTITNVSPKILPRVSPAGGYEFIVTGTGFGSAPAVTINDTPMTITASSTTSITAVIPAGTILAAPATLKVTNTLNEQFAVWVDITITDDTPPVPVTPTITSVTPNSGTSANFPVTILGTNFDTPSVYFGNSQMPVQEWTATRIIVTFPVQGITMSGPLNVTVTNSSGRTVTLVNGFLYINSPSGTKPCFVATAAYGSALEPRLDLLRGFRDDILLKSSVGAAFVDAYYSESPRLADGIASHPWLAVMVRLALMPLIYVIQWPVLSVLPCVAAAIVLTRRARSKKI